MKMFINNPPDLEIQMLYICISKKQGTRFNTIGEFKNYLTIEYNGNLWL